LAVENIVPSPTGIRYPQDYSIENLTMLSAAAALDLKNIMVELSYQEDLFNNTSSGYLMVTESMGYAESLNLNGNEFLRMTFSTTGDPSTKIDKLFRVYKMDKRRLEQNMNTVTYCLYFCSEEMLLNEQYKVCRAYTKQPIFLNVLDILIKDLQVPTNKFANIEQTYGEYDFVIPTRKPFDAINWMCMYARPKAGTVGADMIFYEDKYGFNFRSIQSLMKGQNYHNYAYNPKNVSPNDLNEAVYDVLTYEIMNSYDTLNGISSGMFANQLISADILTRKKTLTRFNYNTYDYESVSLNDYPVTNKMTNRKGHTVHQTSGAMTKLIFSNFDEASSDYVKSKPPGSVAHNIYAETYVPYRTAQLALANYIRIKISVAGDSNLTVGMVVGFSLKTINPNAGQPDNFYSGNYLVTAVRHLITAADSNTSKRYVTILELSKESVPTQYATPDNSSSLWTNTVKGII